MNRKAIFTWLTFAALVAMIGCAPPGVTDAPGFVPGEPQAPTEAAAAPADEPTAMQAPAEAGGEEPGAAVPQVPLVPTLDKPPLGFSQPVGGLGQQVIAYTFPANQSDWTMAIKVAPFIEVQLNPPGDLTPVGVVEFGPGSSLEPGIYEVAIDVGTSESPVVLGQMRPITATNTYDVPFDRIPQILNPDRIDNPAYEEFSNLTPPQDVSAAISADGMCFVVLVDTVLPRDDGSPNYIRYCSQPDSYLSVKANFASQYESLIGPIFDAAERFGLQDQLQTEQIISEMEDPARLEMCGEAIAALAGKDLDALRETCGSDITVAPLNVEMREVGFSRPISQFVVASMLGITMRQADAYPIPVAVVVIHESIDTSEGIVRPGEYRMDYWFDANDNFFAATISGAAIDENGNETEVVNQQVPAVPATFVNEDGSAQAGTQISACRIFGRCSFFQKTCP